MLRCCGHAAPRHAGWCRSRRQRRGLPAPPASRNGYKLVLAPEGVPQVSVNWSALAAPVLGWVGAGLLIYRLADLALRRGRTPIARLLRPLAHALSPTVAATMSRQRPLLARGL